MPSESLVPVDGAALFCRQIGSGPTIMVIHGGPDFDHTYLLPDMDRLADRFRLVYYDQRWRGRSQAPLRVEEVNIERDVRDLDALREHLRLERVALLGHSWGGSVAMHYACSHPGRVSHLVLMNTAPACHEDYLLVKAERERRAAADHEALEALAASAAFRDGDPDTVSAFYARFYRAGARHPERLQGLRLQWTRERILAGRAVEQALMHGLFWTPGYTLIPQLQSLRVPTLVIHGDDDFIPVACAARIAQAMPDARLQVLRDCGHFSYIEAPQAVRQALIAFLPEG